jgi:DNA processing protein
LTTTTKNLQDWLTLHLAPGLGAASIRRLIDHFGGPGPVLQASARALAQVQGIRRDVLTALQAISKEDIASRAAAELEKVLQYNIDLITWDQDRYPDLLRTIHNPPMILYLKGSAAALHSPGVGMVGSRAATDYGKETAYTLGRALAGRGFTIISGLALGIDAAAHKGAMAAGGSTIGVLGCGLDRQYPPENRKLYGEIPAAGALISEYPLGTPPDSFRFPARNRIISGLALGVVVVEASKRSGSLITAQHALEQGREVFAIPGRVDSVKSAGTHSLLQQGAKLVHRIDDIIEELPVTAAADHMAPPSTALQNIRVSTSAAGLTDDEALLFSCLDVYPKNIDDLARAANLSPQKASELLLLLELKGVIKALPGKCYAIVKA